MKKKGFTLVELMGVILLLAVIVLITFPSIVNIIKRSDNKIDAATEALIISAAKIYVEQNKNAVELQNGKNHCVTIQELINRNLLISNLKDAASDEDIDPSRGVSIMVSGSNGQLKYSYEVLQGNCP